jgi:hypothetical protein
MLNGDASALRDEMLKNNAEAVRKVVQQMVSSFDMMEQLAGKITDFMTVFALRQRPTAAAGEDMYEAFHAFWTQVDPPQITRWEAFKDMAPKVFGAMLYAAGASVDDVNRLIGQLAGAGLSIPASVQSGVWTQYSACMQNRPNLDHTDLDGACRGVMRESVWSPGWRARTGGADHGRNPACRPRSARRAGAGRH